MATIRSVIHCQKKGLEVNTLLLRLKPLKKIAHHARSLISIQITKFVSTSSGKERGRCSKTEGGLPLQIGKLLTEEERPDQDKREDVVLPWID